VFGGIDHDLYNGKIFYSPIVKEMYYEVIIADMAINDVSLAMDCKEVRQNWITEFRHCNTHLFIRRTP
jgi:hypothetical protein